MTQRLFLTFSELQVRDATPPRRRRCGCERVYASRAGAVSRRRRSTQVVALADVLLHPSRSEGFGMLVLEAQHIGVPVITTRRGAMKDYTMHGVSVSDSA